MINIELTKEEAIALIQLIDIATKSGGLQVAAAAASVLASKVQKELGKETLPDNSSENE